MIHDPSICSPLGIDEDHELEHDVMEGISTTNERNLLETREYRDARNPIIAGIHQNRTKQSETARLLGNVFLVASDIKNLVRSITNRNNIDLEVLIRIELQRSLSTTNQSIEELTEMIQNIDKIVFI